MSLLGPIWYHSLVHLVDQALVYTHPTGNPQDNLQRIANDNSNNDDNINNADNNNHAKIITMMLMTKNSDYDNANDDYDNDDINKITVMVIMMMILIMTIIIVTI